MPCLSCTCSDCLSENEDAVQCSGFSRCSRSVILSLFWSPGCGPSALYKGVHRTAHHMPGAPQRTEQGPILRSVVKIMNPSKWIIFVSMWSLNPSSSCSACLSVSCGILDENNSFFPSKKILNIPCSHFECLTSHLFCTPSDKFPVETGFVQETLLWKNSDALWRVLRLGPVFWAGCRLLRVITWLTCLRVGDIWWSHGVMGPGLLWHPCPMIRTTCCWSLADKLSSPHVSCVLAAARAKCAQLWGGRTAYFTTNIKTNASVLKQMSWLFIALCLCFCGNFQAR